MKPWKPGLYLTFVVAQTINTKISKKKNAIRRTLQNALENILERCSNENILSNWIIKGRTRKCARVCTTVQLARPAPSTRLPPRAVDRISLIETRRWYLLCCPSRADLWCILLFFAALLILLTLTVKGGPRNEAGGDFKFVHMRARALARACMCTYACGCVHGRWMMCERHVLLYVNLS